MNTARKQATGDSVSGRRLSASSASELRALLRDREQILQILDQEQGGLTHVALALRYLEGDHRARVKRLGRVLSSLLQERLIEKHEPHPDHSWVFRRARPGSDS